ncbi:MAG: metal-dependent transcriptional regulator [Calditrichia bacterium]
MNDVWKKFDETELTHSSVHHLMAVYDLIKQNGYARAVDISRHLNLTRGSISVTLNKLKNKNYLEEDQNKFYRLTDKGKAFICAVLSKRQILKKFFREVLLLPEETAESDACKIEHLLSRETGEKLLTFMGYYLSDNPEVKKFREALHLFHHDCPGEDCLVCENECYFAGTDLLCGEGTTN